MANTKKRKKNRLRLFSFGGLDIPMLTILLVLMMFGLVVLYSSSYAYAYHHYGNSFLYINAQLRYAVIGLIGMFAASFIDYHVWKKFAWAIMAFTLFLLVIVLFMRPGNMNATRWIWLGGGTNENRSFQPSEIAKFAVILLFAHLISTHQQRMKTFTYGFLPFMVILGVVAVLLYLEPHISCLILIVGIGVCMMYAGGTSLKWFFIVGAAGIALIGLIVMFPNLLPHAYERIDGWINSENDMIYQTRQALIAIGSGGVTGRGIGNSRQKFLYLPEMYNDYIFAVLCEELGMIGALVVIALFLLFLVRGLYIGFRAKDKFGSMLAIGISVQVVIQAFLHMAVNTNILPSTGIALPFFSYGGTALCMILGEVGVLLSVSRQADLPLRRKTPAELQEEAKRAYAEKEGVKATV